MQILNSPNAGKIGSDEFVADFEPDFSPETGSFIADWSDLLIQKYAMNMILFCESVMSYDLYIVFYIHSSDVVWTMAPTTMNIGTFLWYLAPPPSRELAAARRRTPPNVPLRSAHRRAE